MVKYFDMPIKQSAKEFAENEHNEGKTGLFNIKSGLMYAEGDDTDWVELEEKRETFDDWKDYCVVTGPISRLTIHSVGWR